VFLCVRESSVSAQAFVLQHLWSPGADSAGKKKSMRQREKGETVLSATRKQCVLGLEERKHKHAIQE